MTRWQQRLPASKHATHEEQGRLRRRRRLAAAAVVVAQTPLGGP